MYMPKDGLVLLEGSSVAVLILVEVCAAARPTEPRVDAAAGQVDAEVAPVLSAVWPSSPPDCLKDARVF